MSSEFFTGGADKSTDTSMTSAISNPGVMDDTREFRILMDKTETVFGYISIGIIIVFLIAIVAYSIIKRGENLGDLPEVQLFAIICGSLFGVSMITYFSTGYLATRKTTK
jgi:hypothetical protein